MQLFTGTLQAVIHPSRWIALRNEGAWGWGLFGFVWLCAIIGTIVSFRKMEEHSNVETICFIVMGLSVLVAFKPLYAIAAGTCYWMIAEGVSLHHRAVFYSFPTAIYAFCLPLLRTGRIGMSHGGGMAYPIK